MSTTWARGSTSLGSSRFTLGMAGVEPIVKWWRGWLSQVGDYVHAIPLSTSRRPGMIGLDSPIEAQQKEWLTAQEVLGLWESCPNWHGRQGLRYCIFIPERHPGSSSGRATRRKRTTTKATTTTRLSNLRRMSGEGELANLPIVPTLGGAGDCFEEQRSSRPPPRDFADRACGIHLRFPLV